MNDAKKMIQASCYYPTLLAAASSPLRFLDQIQRIKNMVRSGKAGRVLTIEAKLKDNVSSMVKLGLTPTHSEPTQIVKQEYHLHNENFR